MTHVNSAVNSSYFSIPLNMVISIAMLVYQRVLTMDPDELEWLASATVLNRWRLWFGKTGQAGLYPCEIHSFPPECEIPVTYVKACHVWHVWWWNQICSWQTFALLFGSLFSLVRSTGPAFKLCLKQIDSFTGDIHILLVGHNFCRWYPHQIMFAV